MFRLPMLFLTLFIAGCGNPDEIVFGPEPLKQMAEQGEQFKKLSQDDRILLVGYLTHIEKEESGSYANLVAGRTVREVLIEAKKQKAEAESIRNRTKRIADELSSSVEVAIIDKIVSSGEFLMLQYAVENRTGRIIRQLKGEVTFKDATGDEILMLDIDIEEPVAPGETLITTTDKGWTFFRGQQYGIGRIVGRDLNSMKVTFKPTAIAFEGGYILKAPE